jgi:FKBP-type peptidyl-prolyl cis-trans isomerase (trigger factor)
VAVQPEIKLERVGGFSLARPKPVVDDAAVTEQLDKLRERKAAWLPVEGKPAPGHMVRVEVAPIEDGKVGEAAPYNLVIGQNQAIPDLEERIMTLSAGETAETDVKFPDDHPDEARRGQSRTVRITLHEVKRQELPALDDAFAREVGEFDSLQALTDAIAPTSRRMRCAVPTSRCARRSSTRSSPRTTCRRPSRWCTAGCMRTPRCTACRRSSCRSSSSSSTPSPRCR